MEQHDIAALLARYLSGKVSAVERERIESWLQKHEAEHAPWRIMPEQEKGQWLADVFTQVKATIQASDKQVVLMPVRKRLPLRIAVAAAVIVAVAFTYSLWPGRSIIQPAALTAIQVPAHQKKQIVLPDSSMVWVNEGSELKYPKSFGGSTREVYLSGEAYFDIRHDATKPFIIHTGKVFTTVLGTAFNIREDKNLHAIVVTVTRGRVKVSGSKRDFGIITPNQQISVDEAAETAIQRNVDALQSIVWKEDDLQFDNLVFGEVAKLLEGRYHVAIRFANNKVKQCRFTGNARASDTLGNILKAICSFNHATYQILANGDIVIDGPGCN